MRRRSRLREDARLGARRARERGGALAAALGLLLAVASPVLAQTPRPIQVTDPAAIESGRLTLQVGAEYGANVGRPLSGLRGDLWSLGEARLRLGLSSTVELRAAWTVQHLMGVTSRENPAVELSLPPNQSRTRDFGDVSLGVVMRVLEARGARPALGLRLETRLPTTNEGRGIGTNTTDVFTTVVASHRLDRWTVLADIGIGILEAPAEVGEQNDVFVYDVSATAALSDRLRAFAGVEGRLNTRRRIPVGTEDRGTFIAGGELLWGRVRIDAAARMGLHEGDPDWGFTFGAAWERSTTGPDGS